MRSLWVERCAKVFFFLCAVGTVLMAIALPCGTLIAVYLSEYARPSLRQVFKPLLETLAGIPTLVYGFFAITTLAPFLRSVGEAFHLSLSTESALSAGI